MDERHVTDRQQVLADLARRGADNRKEIALAVGPAVSAPAQPVRVISPVNGNLYSVEPVILGAVGASPEPMAEPTEAFNLAEPFQSPGALAAGTYALMFRLGDKNAFYAVP